MRQAIKVLDFYPNINAHSLASGKSGLFGLIYLLHHQSLLSSLVKTFEDFTLEKGQEVLIANTEYDPKRRNDCITRFLQRKVEGVAIMTSEMDGAGPGRL